MQVRALGAPLAVLGLAGMALLAGRWLTLPLWMAATAAVALLALASLRLPAPRVAPAVATCAHCVGSLAHCVATLGLAAGLFLCVLGFGTRAAENGFLMLATPVLLGIGSIYIAGRRLKCAQAKRVIIDVAEPVEAPTARPKEARSHPVHS